MKVIANIEKGKDGTYDITMTHEALDYMLLGQGNSVKEAKEDFMICYNEMKALYEDEKKTFVEISDIEYRYDTASFLQYYNQFITLAGMQRLTGINQAQLSHYIQGVRNPSPKTAKKIQEKIHEFGKELQHLEFA